MFDEFYFLGHPDGSVFRDYKTYAERSVPYRACLISVITVAWRSKRASSTNICMFCKYLLQV